MWRFPMPDSELIDKAYWDLDLSEDGTDDARRRGSATPIACPKPWDIATCTEPDLRRDVWEWYDRLRHLVQPRVRLGPGRRHDPALLAAAPAPRPRDRRHRRPTPATSRWPQQQRPRGVAPLRRPRLPGAAPERVKQHCDEDHQPWPARTRFARHQAVDQVQDRLAAFESDLRAPIVSQDKPDRPRLMIVDQNGDLIDPETGEVP